MPVVDVDLAAVRWADWSDDPYPLYRLLRDERPVFHDEPNGVYVVTRYVDVSTVLSDPTRFSNVPVWLLGREEERVSPLREEDPPRHTLLRRIVMPMFTPSEMRRLEPYFRQVACELLDAAEQGEDVEVSSQLAIPLPGRVTCDLLGVPLEEHERFMELTAERLALLNASSGRHAEPVPHRALPEIRADLWSIVGPVVEARRRRPEHDAITLLVQAQDRHGAHDITDELIVDMLLHLLTGGFHTTQHLIELLTSLLADRPDLWQRLRGDRSLVLPAIEEMLRLDAPVQALRRRVVEPTVLRDVELPANATLSAVYGSANRDERVFEDPDTFSLDRRPNRHMAFSAGIHYCPGAPVSRFEVRALYDEMLDRYEAIERVGPSERWPTNQRTVEAMHGLRRVPVRFVRAAA
jgi:cytochrome P450